MPTEATAARRAKDHSPAIHGWGTGTRKNASPARDERTSAERNARDAKGKALLAGLLALFLRLLAFFAAVFSWLGGIPAKKSRERLDNGLLIDVPGIPGSLILATTQGDYGNR